MRYLWDTDTCIYYLNEHAGIRQKVQNHMIIVTNNTDHFNRIPDIRLENWVDE